MTAVPSQPFCQPTSMDTVTRLLGVSSLQRESQVFTTSPVFQKLMVDTTLPTGGAGGPSIMQSQQLGLIAIIKRPVCPLRTASPHPDYPTAESVSRQCSATYSQQHVHHICADIPFTPLRTPHCCNCVTSITHKMLACQRAFQH